MRIKIQSEDLKNAISKLEKVLVYYKDLDILNNIFITADQEIRLTVDNLESTLIMVIPGYIETKGQCLIHKDNFKTTKKLSGEITITASEEKVSISGKRSFEFIQGMVSEYPIREKEFSDIAFTIPSNEFKDMLKIKTFAAKSEESRPVLASINIRNNKAWSLDGFRAAEIVLNIDNQFNKDIPIPIKSIEQIDKIIDKKDKTKLTFKYITKENDSNRVELLSIEHPEWQFITRIIDGEYYNLDQIIPKDFSIINNINKKEFAEVLDFLKDINNKGNVVIANITEDKINIIKESETQKVIEEIAVSSEFKNGIAELRIGFNDKFLMDVVNTINDDNMIFNYVGNNSNPLLITNSDRTEKYLILPVRIA